MDDRRSTTRRRVLKEGKIVFVDGLRVLDCTIRDMSDKGARLLIANPIGVPATFLLLEKSSGMLHPASVIWQRQDSIGVKFDGPATSIHDEANKRFARLRLQL